MYMLQTGSMCCYRAGRYQHIDPVWSMTSTNQTQTVCKSRIIGKDTVATHTGRTPQPALTSLDCLNIGININIDTTMNAYMYIYIYIYNYRRTYKTNYTHEYAYKCKYKYKYKYKYEYACKYKYKYKYNYKCK